MAASTYFLIIAFLALVTSQAIASDPSPLQDFCVADIHSPGMHALSLNNALYSCTKLQIKSELYVRTNNILLCMYVLVISDRCVPVFLCLCICSEGEWICLQGPHGRECR
jgi:hypothetical protein